MDASHFQTDSASELHPRVGAPVIGLPGWRFPAGRAYRLSASVDLPSAYCDAVVAAGGLPFLLTPYFARTDADDRCSATVDESHSSGGWLDHLVDRLDGVVLTGGPDLQPSLYGQAPHTSVYLTSAVQDDFEIALYRTARRRGIPILAICRGMQLVNVVHGGTLVQHLGDKPNLLAHGVPEGGGAARTTPRLAADSEVCRVMGTADPTGNCHHHQAVATVGAGLKVVGRTSDGIVEALAPTDDAELIAVQWHPEETALDDPSQLGLFSWLVERAFDIAASRPPNAAR